MKYVFHGDLTFCVITGCFTLGGPHHQIHLVTKYGKDNVGDDFEKYQTCPANIKNGIVWICTQGRGFDQIMA